MSVEVESDTNHKNGCWSMTSSKLTCDRMRKAKDFVAEESMVAVERLPEFIRFYCCFCCYRKRKSIGVVQENNATCNGTPIIPITIAPEVNKPQQQLQNDSQNHETTSEKSLNGMITNGQGDDERIFNKSAIALERARSSASGKNDLEETQSFRQIDSVSTSSSRKRDTPNETSSTKSIGKGSQESVVLPNSVDETLNTNTPSTKSFNVQSAASRAESWNSTKAIAESRPASSGKASDNASMLRNGPEIFRTESVMSKTRNDFFSRPQSEISGKTHGSVDAASIKSEKQDAVSRKSNDFDEVDRAIDVIQVDGDEEGLIRQSNESTENDAETKPTSELNQSRMSLQSRASYGVTPTEEKQTSPYQESEREFPTEDIPRNFEVEKVIQNSVALEVEQYENESTPVSNKSAFTSTPLPLSPETRSVSHAALQNEPTTPTTPISESKSPIGSQSKPLTPVTPQPVLETPITTHSQPESPKVPQTPSEIATTPQPQTEAAVIHSSHPETPTTPHSQIKTPTTPHSQAKTPTTTPVTPIIPYDIFESPLPIRSTSIPSLNQEYASSPDTPISISKRTPTPGEQVPPRHSSLAKSNDSIFDATRKLEPDTKSTASTTSSDYHPKILTNIAKTANSPLIRKSKTTLFGRNRRVSPVKQSIKVIQAEVFPQSLTRFDKPKDALSLALMDLDSSEWETVIIGLRALVRMMRHHPEILVPQMHIICVQLGRAVRNLRSQVARAACQASTELFTIPTKNLEQECDDLVGDLLHRTADTNRFLRADAMRALEAMCDNMSPPKIIHVLSTKGLTHQNATVRTATAKLLNRLVDRIGHDRVFSLGREPRDKLINMAANLLQEGCLETRSYTKTLFRSLAEHSNCPRILKEVIPFRTYRNIEKTLKSIV